MPRQQKEFVSCGVFFLPCFYLSYKLHLFVCYSLDKTENKSLLMEQLCIAVISYPLVNPGPTFWDVLLLED